MNEERPIKMLNKNSKSHIGAILEPETKGKISKSDPHSSSCCGPSCLPAEAPGIMEQR